MIWWTQRVPVRPSGFFFVYRACTLAHCFVPQLFLSFGVAHLHEGLGIHRSRCGKSGGWEPPVAATIYNLFDLVWCAVCHQWLRTLIISVCPVIWKQDLVVIKVERRQSAMGILNDASIRIQPFLRFLSPVLCGFAVV